MDAFAPVLLFYWALFGIRGKINRPHGTEVGWGEKAWLVTKGRRRSGPIRNAEAWEDMQEFFVFLARSSEISKAHRRKGEMNGAGAETRT